MNRTNHKQHAALFGALMIGILSGACNQPNPTPQPVIPPTPTYIVGAINDLERPTIYTAFNTTLNLTLAANETTGRILNFPNCVAPSVTNLPAGITVDFFAMQTINLTQISHTGSATGNYVDPLVPYSSGCLSGYVFADIAVAAGTAPGTYPFLINDLAVTITVNKFNMPSLPTVPLYIGLDPWSVLTAHGLSSDSDISIQAPLAQNYIQLMRAHRIEPFGQVPNYPPIVNGSLDIDQYSDYDGSFRQTTVTGALGEVCMQVHSSQLQTQSYYQATEATLQVETFKAWNYLVDEPTDADLPAVVAAAQLSKQYAPSMETMMTHQPVQSLIGLIDHFTVIFEQFKTSGNWSDYSQAPGYWIYGSCSSHGSCENGYTAANTGTPDLSIDQTTMNSRMYPIVIAALGAQAGFYYASNTDYGAMDVWTNQYNFGGNGDGQLFYPAVSGQMGFTSNFAIASLRMKMLRQGMFDVEYLKTYGFNGIVSDQTHWTTNHADIDALRQKAL